MATVVESGSRVGAFPCIQSGRKFYESIGSPRYVVAPMVDRSEFAWRMLTRSYMDEEESKRLLAYTPMFHARLFSEQAKFRDEYFQPTKQSLTTKEASTEKPYLDGNPEIDRPLFVQFCANKPDDLLEAASYVAPYCDAVDLNLGCPQGIARSGKYGAFLQEDWATIYNLINRLHNELLVPVTAKIRVLDTKEKTLDYAKMVLSAGASILTVHGRRREQKSHNTGVADWKMIRYLRDNLPPELVLFANGNILNAGDLDGCLEATGADAIMSAEGNLSDPTIFAKPPSDPDSREYWRGPNGKGGYRIDAVLRRYLDIIYKHVLEQEPPHRQPLYIPTDQDPDTELPILSNSNNATEEPQSKNRKQNSQGKPSPSLRFMQGHLFGFLKILFTKHTHIRDLLQKTRPGDMATFERILSMVEDVTRQALREEARNSTHMESDASSSSSSSSLTTEIVSNSDVSANGSEMTPSQSTALKYGRPWWVCQPHIRPLPEEAIKNGAMQVSKKDMAKAALGQVGSMDVDPVSESHVNGLSETDGGVVARDESSSRTDKSTVSGVVEKELPKEALVCG